MKIRLNSLCLLPLALGLLVSSCKDDPKNNKGQEEVVVPKATPEQRAAKLGSLAMIPAGTSAVVAVYDVDGIVQKAKQSDTALSLQDDKAPVATELEKNSEPVETKVDTNQLMEGESKDVVVTKDEKQPVISPDMADFSCPVKELVIAVGSKQPEFINKLLPSLRSAYSMEKVSSLMKMSSNIMKNGPAKSQLEEMSISFFEKNAVELLKGLSETLDLTPGDGTAPLMIIATLTPEIKALTQQNIAQFSAMSALFTQGMAFPHNVKACGMDFKGVVIDGQKISQTLSKMLANEEDNAKKLLMTELVNKVTSVKFYILTAFKGDQLIAVICTNPEKQIQLAASPAQSVLSADDFSFVDGKLESKLAGITYLSPSMAKSLILLQETSSQGALTGYTTGVRKIAHVLGVNKEKAESICTSLIAATNSTIKLSASANTDVAMTTVGWWEQGLQIEVSSGLDKSFNWDHPSTLSGVNAKALPEATLTGYCSLNKDVMTNLISIVENWTAAAWGASEIIVTNPQVSISNEIRMYYAGIKMMEPQVKQYWADVTELIAITSGEKAIVVQLDGSMPAIDLAKEMSGLAIPRVSTVCRIADKSKLAPAWDKMFSAMNNTCASLGQPAPFVGVPEKKIDGSWTSYWYQSPLNAGNFMPAVTIGDALLVAGSSRELNEKVAKIAAIPLADNVNVAQFHLQIAPLVKSTKDWINKCSQEDKDAEFCGMSLKVMESLPKDMKFININVFKRGERMIQQIHFKEAK